MLPQFGLAEFLLVAIVALIVVGPRDLPIMMRRLGQFVAKGRAMAGEFRAAFDDIAKQAELDELRKEIEDLKRDNAVTAAVEDLKEAERDINASVMASTPAVKPATEAADTASSEETASPSSEPAADAKPKTDPV
ncbi:MAG: Sec-independent protein translocase protein TatB [Henriciella sp.]|nr:Sec-independent protein translocase protein TatB [Henriciella sp.]